MQSCIILKVCRNFTVTRTSLYDVDVINERAHNLTQHLTRWKKDNYTIKQGFRPFSWQKTILLKGGREYFRDNFFFWNFSNASSILQASFRIGNGRSLRTCIHSKLIVDLPSTLNYVSISLYEREKKGWLLHDPNSQRILPIFVHNIFRILI